MGLFRLFEKNGKIWKAEVPSWSDLRHWSMLWARWRLLRWSWRWRPLHPAVPGSGRSRQRSPDIGRPEAQSPLCTAHRRHPQPGSRDWAHTRDSLGLRTWRESPKSSLQKSPRQSWLPDYLHIAHTNLMQNLLNQSELHMRKYMDRLSSKYTQEVKVLNKLLSQDCPDKLL